MNVNGQPRRTGSEPKFSPTDFLNGQPRETFLQIQKLNYLEKIAFYLFFYNFQLTWRLKFLQRDFKRTA